MRCILFTNWTYYFSAADFVSLLLLRKPTTHASAGIHHPHIDFFLQASFASGKPLDGLKHVLLLVMLQDARTVRSPTLQQQQVLPLEQLIYSNSQLAVLPNLLRCLNSTASIIEGRRWKHVAWFRLDPNTP